MGCSCARSALWCVLAHHRVLQVACPSQKPGYKKGLHSASAPDMPVLPASVSHVQFSQSHLHMSMITTLTPMVTALSHIPPLTMEGHCQDLHTCYMHSGCEHGTTLPRREVSMGFLSTVWSRSANLCRSCLSAPSCSRWPALRA